MAGGGEGGGQKTTRSQSGMGLGCFSVIVSVFTIFLPKTVLGKRPENDRFFKHAH